MKRKRQAATNKGSSLSLTREIAASEKKAEEKPKKRIPKKKQKVKQEDPLSPLSAEITVTKQEVEEFNKIHGSLDLEVPLEL